MGNIKQGAFYEIIFSIHIDPLRPSACFLPHRRRCGNSGKQYPPAAVVSDNITSDIEDTDIVTDVEGTANAENTTDNTVTSPLDDTETAQPEDTEPVAEYYYGNDRYIASRQEDTPSIRFIRWYKNDKRHGEPAIICKKNPDSEEFLFEPLVVSCGQMKCSLAIGEKYFALVVDEQTDIPHLYYLNEGKELSLVGLNCSNISLCPIVKDDTLYLFTAASAEADGMHDTVTFYSLGIKTGEIKKLNTFKLSDYAAALPKGAYVIKTTCHYYEQYTSLDNKSGTLELNDALNANNGTINVAYTIEDGKVAFKKAEIH